MDIPFSDPKKHAAAVDDLLLAKDVLDGMGAEFWLSNGTLLGAVRDRDFIAHDSDIDLGLWSDGCDHVEVRRQMVRHGFRVLTEFGAADRPGHQYAFHSPGAVYLDIFFYTQEPDCCWMPLWAGGEFKRMTFPPILEFRMLEFLGEQFRVPANYEEILTANYGDWRTPEPVWSWSDSPKNLR